MAKFNSAKMIGADDKGFQQKYNELIDLLDTGYVVESMRSGKHLKIQLNSDVGMKMTVDGSSIFSIDPVTGRVVIGYYDAELSDLATDITAAQSAAQENLAQKLGYANYAGMVAEATAGNTIITGGYLRTSLIQADTLLFSQFNSATQDAIVQTGESYKGVVIDATNGFVSTATIGGKTVSVKLNATDGLAFYDGAAYRGGLKVVNGKLALVSDVIGNPSNLNHFIDYDIVDDDIYGMLFWSPYGNSSEKTMAIYGYASEFNTVAHIGAVGGTKRTSLNLFANAGLTPALTNGSYIMLDGGTPIDPSIQMIAIKGVDSTVLNIYKDYFEVKVALEEKFKVTSTGATILGNTVWHSGNDGSGSGLDADLLDGNHASAFSPSGHTHNYARAYTSANGYEGITLNDGSAVQWLRTTVNGILPYASGGSSALGSSAWPFNNIYGKTIYENGVALSSKYLSAAHTHSSDTINISYGNASGSLLAGNAVSWSTGTNYAFMPNFYSSTGGAWVSLQVGASSSSSYAGRGGLYNRGSSATHAYDIRWTRIA